MNSIDARHTMSSAKITSKWFRLSWHNPAAWAGSALILAVILYYTGPLFLAWIAIKNNSSLTYEDWHRKFVLNPAQVQATPQAIPAPNQETPPQVAQNSAKLDAPVEQPKSVGPQEKAPSVDQRPTTKPTPQVGTSKPGPIEQNPKPSKIALGPPIDLLPKKKATGGITIEVPFPLGDQYISDTPTKNSYTRDGLFWMHQSYKCEHYGDEPMYEACYMAPQGPKKKRPLVRAW